MRISPVLMTASLLLYLPEMELKSPHVLSVDAVLYLAHGIHSKLSTLCR